ncbi:polysaccharide deacetylase family protein [Pedobacter sp. MR2016-24]|uniref:polysaccharide deacetylase family protein n=1 Tax=Pedobacter sp. MR2016-24 TaxID=2994466 RepID=UPI002247CE4F|nr:polysaccharide deacetylase family protein [Pedobacter sp. MR2016-24]MCX2483006.1 polysaccharide deacetylase family protein [Pedobacter sp. MR2016-24]
MKNYFLSFTAAAIIFTAGCQSKSQTTAKEADQQEGATTTATAEAPGKTVDVNKVKVADAKTILARKQVPVLCYHQIRDWKPKDSQTAKDYITPIATFKGHMKMLADSGYHTILLDQLYDYLNNGTPLPSKPIVLTFDDTDLDQYTIAAPEMKKYGFKGAFFVMTVSLGRPNYMSKAQVKDLSDQGQDIGSHTWDHHNVKKYQGKDWETQIDKPTKTLEEITGKKIYHFAYPFGLWNPEAIPELKKRGFKSAFILSTKRDENDPLFTIRRIIASGYWTPKTLSNSIKNSF